MIRFIHIAFLIILSKEIICNINEQNQEDFDPLNDPEDLGFLPKDQSKRTIFGPNTKAWAKHVGYHPSGQKFVLGYSPVNYKYTPVIKPLHLRPVKMQFHGWKPLLNKFRPHFRPIGHGHRPVLPFKPSMPLGHWPKDNGWKPVTPLPPNVPPPSDLNLSPWQEQGWPADKPKPSIPVGSLVPIETEPVKPIVTVKPIVPLKPLVPVAPTVPVHVHPPVHIHHPVHIGPVVPVAPEVTHLHPVPLNPFKPVVPAHPHLAGFPNFVPQPAAVLPKPTLPVLPLGSTFPSQILPPGLLKNHVHPQPVPVVPQPFPQPHHLIPQPLPVFPQPHHLAPQPLPVSPLGPHAAQPIFPHVAHPIPSGPAISHPVLPVPPVTHLKPIPGGVAPVSLPGTGSIEFHGKAAHLIPFRSNGLLPAASVFPALPPPQVIQGGLAPGVHASAGVPILPGGHLPAAIPQGHLQPTFPGHHLVPVPGSHLAPSPLPVLPGAAGPGLPAVPVNAQIPAFDFNTFFQRNPGVTPVFPIGQGPNQGSHHGGDENFENHFHPHVHIVTPQQSGDSGTQFHANSNPQFPSFVGTPSFLGTQPPNFMVSRNPNSLGSHPNFLGAQPNFLGSQPNFQETQPTFIGSQPNDPSQMFGSHHPNIFNPNNLRPHITGNAEHNFIHDAHDTTGVNFVPGENLPQDIVQPINHHAFSHLAHQNLDEEDTQGHHLTHANLAIQPGQTDLHIPLHLPQHPNFRQFGSNIHRGDDNIGSDSQEDGSNEDTFRPSPAIGKPYFEDSNK